MWVQLGASVGTILCGLAALALSRIAETLCITTATTRTHLRNIYAKLGVHSQQDILDMYEDFASRG